MRVLDPELDAALTPIINDVLASGGLLIDIRESGAHSQRRRPGYLYATAWAPDGSGAGVSVQAGWPRAAQVVGLAEQIQEIVIEARWRAHISATWPECPSHPNSHPLEPALVSERAVWRCPKSSEAPMEIGTIQADHHEFDDLEPDDYEALTGVSKGEYETELLQSAQRIITGPNLDGEVQSVTLDAESSMLLVVFTVTPLPGRVFGWRVPIWPAPHPRAREVGTTEGLALIRLVHLLELINELPHGVRLSIDESGVEWTDPFQ